MHTSIYPDNLANYEAARTRLSGFPNDLNAKHNIVLALANMGSLDLAESEYKRLGLDKIKDEEDIMCLGARLLKDTYLESDSENSSQFARESAELYEHAHVCTNGYYSSVNAATMALISGAPLDVVNAKVQRTLVCLDALEPPFSRKEAYFREATRAECFYLMGQDRATRHSLADAQKYDPLNYIAHGTTLKQFALIAKFKNGKTDWLNAFLPPKPFHYAGAIEDFEDALKEENIHDLVVDKIQTNDLGFGYGALAAGSDIVIAEAILDEGGELNVILPCSVNMFKSTSVAKFGETWIPRFEACLERAASVTCLFEKHLKKLLPSQTLVASEVAMGQAIMRAQHLNVLPQQMLNMPKGALNSHTNHCCASWDSTNFSQIMISANANESNSTEYTEPDLVRVENPSMQNTTVVTTLDSALSLAQAERYNPLHDNLLLVRELESKNDIVTPVGNLPFRGAVLASEAVACSIVVHHGTDWNVQYAGFVDTHTFDQKTKTRLYTLQPKARRS